MEATQKTSAIVTRNLVMRDLQAGDVITILSLLAKSVGTADEVRKLLGDIKTNRRDWTAVGISAIWGVLQGLLVRSQAETITWLASLLSLSKEEFERLPPSATIDVIEMLVRHKDFGDFFERLEAAFSRSAGATEKPGQPMPNDTSAVSSTESKPATDGPTP